MMMAFNNEYALIGDECLSALYEAQSYLNQLQEIDDYSLLFEAEMPEVNIRLKNNDGLIAKAKAAAIKAIDVVISAIRNLISSIKNFFDELTLDSKDRLAFNDFKEACKLDPTLKDKKVTVQDFRKINQEYEKLLKEIEETQRQLKIKEGTPIDNLVKKVKGFVSGNAQAASIIVTASVAEKMALSNVEVAKKLSFVLNSDLDVFEGLKDSLKKELGEKEYNRMKKNIDNSAKQTILGRLKTTLYSWKYRNAKDVIDKTSSDLIKLMSDSNLVKVAGVLKHPKMMYNMITNDTLKDTAKKVMTANSAAKQAEKDIEKRKKAEAKRDKKMEKKRKKNKDKPVASKDKSAIDFFTGR